MRSLDLGKRLKNYDRENATNIKQTKDFGYALLRVDARGIGGSQGKLDPFGLERSLVIQDDAEGQGKMLILIS